MNLFASLELGRKALHAASVSLDVAGNNIANVNTPGFSRRRAELSEAAPVSVGRFLLGNGVVALRVSRVVDGLLLAQARLENTAAGRDEAASAGLRQVESILGETAGGGISSALSAFYGVFSRLSAAPEDPSLRREAAGRADALARTIRDRAEGIESFRRETDAAVTETVSRVASLSSDIASLNRRIQFAEPGAGEAAGLRDQRALRLRELAGLVDIQVAEGKDGSAYVSLAGSGDALVVEDRAIALAVSRDASGYARVQVRRSGVLTDVTDRLRGGKLGGLLQVRDDQAGRYAQELDRLATDLVTRANAVHRAGVDGSGAAGGDLFAPTAAGASSARTLAVSAAVLADPSRIAAGTSASPGDGSNALALAALERESSVALGGRTGTAFLADFQTRIGVDSRAASSAFETSRAALLAADERIQSLSGVDLDEEAAALMQYQRSYEAAARFLQVVNEMTQTALDTFPR